MTYASALMWFRRDLRAADNAALFHALKAARAVHCVFVFDTPIEQRYDKALALLGLQAYMLSPDAGHS